MKIQVVLEGGLGNQMFQYAIGRSLSLHYGAELSLYTPNIYIHAVKREFQLNYFGIEGTEELIKNARTINEFDMTVEQLYNLPRGNYILKGYWQNEAYFNRHEVQIRKDFDLGVETVPGRLLIQVRRTDYLNNPFHEYCNLDWYKRAISNKSFRDVIFVSDDIAWCKESFEYIDAPKIFIDGNEMDQFRAMYSSESFVISNSSFGWWGAWWTDAKDVTCPAVWTPGYKEYDPARLHWKRLV